MENKLPKRIAFKIQMKNKGLNRYTDLTRVIESKQFTIIEYKKYANAAPVSALIKKLRIENEIEQNDAFLYIKNNLKFVFINADIPDEDKCSLLRHELGHICDPNFQKSEIEYSKIQREEFANEFSYYIKNPSLCLRIFIFVFKKWTLFAGIAVLISFVYMLSLLPISPAKPAAGYPSDRAYYVTSAGRKYHRKHCIIIKYKNNLTEISLNAAAKDGYKPCRICCPAEE